MAARLVEKKVHSERSVESRTTSGQVQREKAVASVDNETAQVKGAVGFISLFILQ